MMHVASIAPRRSGFDQDVGFYGRCDINPTTTRRPDTSGKLHEKLNQDTVP